MPMLSTRRWNGLPEIVSRSHSRHLGAVSHGEGLDDLLSRPVPVGFSVMLKWTTLRRSSASTSSTKICAPQRLRSQAIGPD